MSSNKVIRRAKHEAYEKKQEKKAKKLVNWIFAVLVILGLAFLIYSMFLVS